MTVEASEKQGKPAETGGEQISAPTADNKNYALATFAGGCFWCMEPPFERLEGVKSAVSGYTGGAEKNPSYRQVAGGKTGHTEAVQVTFDPERVSYETLIRVFWSSFNPTDLDGQFADRGSQYRPAVFYHDEIQRLIAEKTRDELNQSGKFSKPVKTQIQPAGLFYPAEDYHQDYYLKNSTHYKAYAAGSGRKGFLDSIWGVGGWPAPWPTTFGGNAAIKDKLTPLQYRVMRENGTEAPFRNEYWDNKEAGIYVDLLSGEPLFASIHKFKSGTGWPSFTQPLESANILELQDNSHGMTRVEVRSRYGGNHLGHVFNDGPAPTGLRYCMNSAALRFIPYEDLSGSAYAQYQELFK